MDPREMETLIQRLVANPHDEEALSYAHQAGTTDPRSYALLLEKVGAATPDPSYAAHWLSEAANVWSTTIGDVHHAARTLMIAIEKDPTQRVAADRLAELYRDKGDTKALVALLERLVKALTPLVAEKPEVREQLTAMHDELGRLWGEPPLARPERALENWRRLAELDPQNAFAIYSARELLKQQQKFLDSIPFFAMEHAIIEDPERRLALYRDEADVRMRGGDGAGATQSLRHAMSMMPDDPALAQEVGSSVLERIESGENVPEAERDEAAKLFIGLAEAYDGDYGMSYSVSALRAAPGDDRAMQLADHYASQLGRTDELRPQYAAYLAANPSGYMAKQAQSRAGSTPPPAPGAAPPPVPPRQPSSPALDEEELRAIESLEAPRPSGDLGSGIADERSRGSIGDEPSAVNLAELHALLDEAHQEVQKGRRTQALAKYRQALKLDPANSDALTWVEEHLRQKRMYADLRDVLLAASRVSSVSAETRKAQLRDVAGLCESQLRDLDTAITAYKRIVQLDRSDEQAREQLRRLLERGARWDDLATLLEQEAMSAPDVEQKISLEKKLASLQEQKRKDPAAAGDAWARIAGLSPEDDGAILTAVRLYERAELADQAASVIADNVQAISDDQARGSLLQKLGELRSKIGDQSAAGDAYAEAADALKQAKLWEQAERAYMSTDRFAEAAHALEQRALLTDGKSQATLFAQAAELLLKVDDVAGAVDKLERASALDPMNDGYAASLEEHYRASDQMTELVTFLVARGEKLSDRGRRVQCRKKAATLQREMGDVDGARESLLLVLNDGDDAESLQELADDAVSRADYEECAEFLRRLAAIASNPQEKLGVAMREAALFADQLGDVEGAIERYETIFRELDPKNRQALASIAELEEKRDNLPGAADALERQLALAEAGERVEIAGRLARMYEGELDNPKAAIKVLEIVHLADPEDFDAVARLQDLSERVEDWPRVATLMRTLLEVEGDEAEASEMARRLAEVYADKLEKGDEALSVLEPLADQGDEACREAYVRMGDALGWKGLVATKLCAWHESDPSEQRTEALRGAFERFIEVDRQKDAARVAVELARSKAADPELGERLEGVAKAIKDVDALAVAHDILARDLSGPARASELVRQAEVQVEAGIDPVEAMQHGESALTSVGPEEVEPLLKRLSALTDAPGHVIDLYERQIGRCRAPGDRLTALSRAAQVAAERGANDRARGFFELALAGGVQEDTLAALEEAARLGDERQDGTALRRILADALAAGGQGSRDGGRTRAALLRRAALIAHRDLADMDLAFGWLGDALITHVEEASLDALRMLGEAVGDMHRVESTLGRALEEVFDGPLVRKLLARRARLRRDVLGDRKGASIDLKKLHDLSPSDHEVMNELSELLLELGDHRGMIQLYEDQILRGRDPAQRAELARKVAHLWEEELGDSREAADAWRRVLRMKPGDDEAQEGLDRAKAGKLKRPAPGEKRPFEPIQAPAAPPPRPPMPSEPLDAAPAPSPVEDDEPLRADSEPPPAPRESSHGAPPPLPVEPPVPTDPSPRAAQEDVESTTDEGPEGLDEAIAARGGIDGPPPSDEGTIRESMSSVDAIADAAERESGGEPSRFDAYNAPTVDPEDAIAQMGDLGRRPDHAAPDALTPEPESIEPMSVDPDSLEPAEDVGTDRAATGDFGETSVEPEELDAVADENDINYLDSLPPPPADDGAPGGPPPLPPGGSQQGYPEPYPGQPYPSQDPYGDPNAGYGAQPGPAGGYPGQPAPDPYGEATYGDAPYGDPAQAGQHHPGQHHPTHAGHGHSGHGQEGYGQPAYPHPGYPDGAQAGQPPAGYPQGGYPQGGHPQAGHPDYPGHPAHPGYGQDPSNPAYGGQPWGAQPGAPGYDPAYGHGQAPAYPAEPPQGSAYPGQEAGYRDGGYPPAAPGYVEQLGNRPGSAPPPLPAAPQEPEEIEELDDLDLIEEDDDSHGGRA